MRGISSPQTGTYRLVEKLSHVACLKFMVAYQASLARFTAIKCIRAELPEGADLRPRFE